VDNVDPDISSIPPLDTEGTAIQNVAFSVTTTSQLVVTLTLLPQMNVQGLRFKNNDLVLDFGMGAQIPYVQTQNATPLSSDTVQPMVITPAPLTSSELATQNYDEAMDLVTQGNIPGAIGVLDMLVSQHPNFLQGRVMLANLLLQQNNSTQALNLLQEATPLPKIQSNSAYYDLLAESYRQTGDPKSAAVIYQQLLRLDGSNGTWWVGLGMCFEALGQLSAATEAYQRAEKSGNLSPLLQVFISKKLGSTA
jgi:predicted Zn-dependent protease